MQSNAWTADTPGLILSHLTPDEPTLWLVIGVLPLVSRDYQAAALEVRADEKWQAFFIARAKVFVETIPELQALCEYLAIMNGMRAHRLCEEVQMRALHALDDIARRGDEAARISRKVVMREMMHHGMFATLTSTMRAYPFEHAGSDWGKKLQVQLRCILIIHLFVSEDWYPDFMSNRFTLTPGETDRVFELARSARVPETVSRLLRAQPPGRGVSKFCLSILDKCAAQSDTH